MTFDSLYEWIKGKSALNRNSQQVKEKYTSRIEPWKTYKGFYVNRC